MKEFKSSFLTKIIYVIRINDTSHLGCLKVGEASSENIFGLPPNSKELNIAAKERVKNYTQTAGIDWELLHTEVAAYEKNDEIIGFRDYTVRDVLYRSGVKKKHFNTEFKANEWVITDLETVKKAITAVKEEKQSLRPHEITSKNNPIIFRPEQKEAIEKTKKQFKKSNEMLWFAKMRFGKTLSALQVIKELKFDKTLILTHRPVVDSGWFEDFNKIFNDEKLRYSYGSKKQGDNFKTLKSRYDNEKSKYVFFASIQDLRGSELVGGNFDKNNELFHNEWDFIIIDEAHEGTQTHLGKNVLSELKKPKTKALHLSGTPFNLIEDYAENEIFTWDYVMEQKAKMNWDKIHFGDPNPYSSLPRMNIYTYELDNILKGFIDEDVAFNFKEFFRVNEIGDFKYYNEIKRFLNLLCDSDSPANYPFAKEEFRENFRHSLWMLPGVKEARALSKLLNRHPVFSNFEIVNVAGDGDEEEKNEEALIKVNNAITEKSHETYSITLSCGRLTTGVSVKAWTAVFMLSGSYNTSASSYMQTIFRVQTPATINGKVKEECFVFDFAPDRTLKVIAEAAKVSAKTGSTGNEERDQLGEFLNFCPIISTKGSRMSEYDVNGLLEQLKKVYIDRVVNNGFEDAYLYNNDELMTLSDDELKEFDSLKKIIGKSSAINKTSDIDLNKQGFTDEEYERLGKAEKKPKKELTEEEKKLLELRKEKKNNRDKAILILRAISVRMPLIIYGADINDEDAELSVDNFTKLIDDQSWVEFMPNEVTKETFKKFKKFYDDDVFRAAGRKIRNVTRISDKFLVEDRIERITSLFSKFKNPDKETVLTPWRTVNMHITDCLGGYTFYDKDFENILEKPRFVNNKSSNIYSINSKILELNSKSGLYPLYMAYNIFKNEIKRRNPNREIEEVSYEDQNSLWDEIIAKNIFVICKTPMAKSITKRTLVGFRDVKVNTRYFEDLVLQITLKQKNFLEKIVKGEQFWKSVNDNNMKFNAIVGNPPYQVMDGGNSVSAKPVYQYFVEIAKKLKPDVFSFIMPARWYAGGKGLDEFRESSLKDKKLSHIFDFPRSNDCFPNVDIAGGVCYLKWDSNYSGDCTITNNINGILNSQKRPLDQFNILVRDNNAISILNKVNYHKRNLSQRVSSRKPFGLPTNYKPKSKGIPCWFIQKIGLKYADEKDVLDNNNYLNKWKVLVPPTPIAGQTDFTKPVGFYYDGNTVIAEPGQCCTESYLIAGAFESKAEAINFKSYLFSKITRFLLLQRVISQHVTKKTFEFIPDLKNYDMEFNDQKLKELWNITNEEMDYINSRIKTI